jgi:hypothetical protein
MDPIQDKSPVIKQSVEPQAKENHQNSVEKEGQPSPYDTSFFDQKLDVPECLSGLSTEHARKVIDRVPPEKLAQICVTEFKKMQAPDISENPLGGIHQSTVVAGMESIIPDEARPLLIRDVANKGREFRNYLNGYKMELDKELEKEEVREGIFRESGGKIDVEQVKKVFSDAFEKMASSAERKSILFGDGPATAPINESFSLIYFPENAKSVITDHFAAIGAKERVSEIEQNPKLGDYVERLIAYHESAHVDDYKYSAIGTPRSSYMGEAEADGVASLKLLSDGIKEGNEPVARYALQLWSDYRDSNLNGIVSVYADNGKVVTEVLNMDSAEFATLSDKDLVSLGSRIADKHILGDNALAERNKALGRIVEKLDDQSLLDEAGKLKQNPELISALQADGVRDIFDRAYSAYQNLNAQIPPSLNEINNYYSTAPSVKSY